MGGEAWNPVRGERVKARTASGSEVVRRVWDVSERLVFLCSERQFRQLIDGVQTSPIVGFPKRDVFRLV
nr:MAG: hypothetical protein DIU62_07325 [Pseudomonadota bacterium]